MGLFSFESKQVKEWKKLAKSGDMEAQYHLARAYANGKGVSINMKRAVDWLPKCTVCRTGTCAGTGTLGTFLWLWKRCRQEL